MTELWSPNLKVGEIETKRIDVSDVDEIFVEAEGYVLVEDVNDD